MRRLAIVLAMGALVAALVPSTALAGKPTRGITGASGNTCNAPTLLDGWYQSTFYVTVTYSAPHKATQLVVYIDGYWGSSTSISGTGSSTVAVGVYQGTGAGSSFTDAPVTAYLADSSGNVLGGTKTIGSASADPFASPTTTCSEAIKYP